MRSIIPANTLVSSHPSTLRSVSEAYVSSGSKLYDMCLVEEVNKVPRYPRTTGYTVGPRAEHGSRETRIQIQPTTKRGGYLAGRIGGRGNITISRYMRRTRRMSFRRGISRKGSRIWGRMGLPMIGLPGLGWCSVCSDRERAGSLASECDEVAVDDWISVPDHRIHLNQPVRK